MLDHLFINSSELSAESLPKKLDKQLQFFFLRSLSAAQEPKTPEKDAEGAVSVRYTVTLPYPARMPLLPSGVIALPDALMNLVADDASPGDLSEATGVEHMGRSHIVPVAIVCGILILVGVLCAAVMLRRKQQAPLTMW